jgi:hypothetical protein
MQPNFIDLMGLRASAAALRERCQLFDRTPHGLSAQ